jgi:acyl-CoA thioester hydrolase
MRIPFHTPLTPEQQAVFGIDVPQPLALADRVRFAELDPLNHVNNKSYMTWFETLRVEYFYRYCRPLYGNLAMPRLVLRNADIRFLREMTIGETYVATARVSAFRSTSYTMEQQLWSGDLRATLRGVMVMLRPDGSGRYPLPDAVCARFLDVDGAVAEI